MKMNGTEKAKVVRVVAAVALVASVLTLAACNTVSGAGKDLQEASDSTKKAIEK